MTVYYQLLLDTILSCAETLILFQMYRAFLRRNSRPNKYYYLGLFSYFVFQLVMHAGPLAAVFRVDLLSFVYASAGLPLFADKASD